MLVLAAICAVLVGGLSALVVSGSRSDASALRDLYERGFQPMLALQDVDRQLKEVRFRLAGVLLEQIPVTGSRNHLKEVRESAPAAWQRYAAASQTPQDARLGMVGQINNGWTKFDAFAADLESAYAQNDRKKLATLLEDEWPPVHIALVKPLEALLPQAISDAEAVYKERSTAASRRQVIAIAGLLVGGLLLTVCLVWFYRRLNGAFSAMAGAMRKLASGDLGARLVSRASAETVVIGKEFDSALDQLNALVARIHGVASQMQIAAKEVARGHAHLSMRTEQQAASLEETAASMEEMTATVSQTADNARKATVLAEGAATVAVQGGQAVGAVVSTMNGISESSTKIGDIIGVIDSIAFQTNILALNAAVEAARAGEQGRGFAVVAAEVRHLAQRSAGASKEIRQLITESVARIATGSQQVTTAGNTMADIVESAQRVNKLVAQISTASVEQAQSLAQVSSTVQQLETVTQQNAAMVGEGSAVSMEAQATALMQAVGGFRLAGDATVPVDALAARPRAVTLRPAPVAPRRGPPVLRKPVASTDWKAF